MKKTLRLMALLLLLVISNSTFAQIEKHQAMYLYNFLSYFEWPSDYRGGEFQIGVLGGGDPVVKELVATTMAKKVGSMNIVIVPFNSVNEISKCHVLFVPARSSALVSEVYEKLKASSTLLVTASTSGIENGAAINYIVVDGKLNFEIKPTNATEHRIKVSASLTHLARKVYN